MDVRVVRVKSFENTGWTPGAVLSIAADEVIEVLEVVPNRFNVGFLIQFVDLKGQTSPVLRVRAYPQNKLTRRQ